MPNKRTIHVVSLGCPKNRVDSEVMLGAAIRSGFDVVDDPAKAEVILVNTCGFIEDAKRESIDTIFEVAEHKITGICQKLVVTGCLAQRYPKELASQIPEIDNLMGSGDLMRIEQVLANEAPRVDIGTPGHLIARTDPRVLSTGAASAYVKIAEGCSRQCAFCVIPKLRGKHRSRSIDDVVREVEMLVAQGVLEVNLVSQDTVAFGRDTSDDSKPQLAELVRRVADVKGMRWVRLLYLYPDVLDAALIELLAHHPRVLPYIDMPMQHAADEVLVAMRRGHSHARLRKTIERLRSSIPGLTLRTAFIVGFPGETDAHFEQLVEFVEWAKFERLGVFRYSDEQETPAYAMTTKVSRRDSYNRARRLMGIQRRIACANNRKLIGQTVEVLVEGSSNEHELVMSGRHAGQAPDIDGQVFFTESEVRAGEIRRAKIVSVSDYDVVATAIDEPPLAAAPRRGPRHLPVVAQ